MSASPAAAAPPAPARTDFACALCGQTYPAESGVAAELLHGELADALAQRGPLPPHSMLCEGCLEQLHGDYFAETLKQEVGELDDLEQEVVKSLGQNELITGNVNTEYDETSTPGQRIADKVAEVGGSWAFIIGFTLVMTFWISFNAHILNKHPFDPYPFILMNLILSTLAAIQAPIIMMSQNRQSTKDRLTAEQDYQVNLKAELQIRHMHDMLGHLLSRQWERMLEIQKQQAALMQHLAEISAHVKPGPHEPLPAPPAAHHAVEAEAVPESLGG
jgi:uncharacterized membrane protein